MGPGLTRLRDSGFFGTKFLEHIAYHRNGRALILGEESHVSHDSFADSSSVIEKSKVFHSSVIASRVERSMLVGSQVMGAVLSDSILDGVSIDGLVVLSEVVAESCELRGSWELTGIARIPCGIWHRAPRFVEINGEEFRAGITESIDGHALIACMRKPMVKWLKFGPRLGRMLGWTPEQVRIAYRTFEQWLDVPMGGTGPVAT